MFRLSILTLPGSLSWVPGRIHIFLCYIPLALNLYELKYWLKPKSSSFSTTPGPCFEGRLRVSAERWAQSVCSVSTFCKEDTHLTGCISKETIKTENAAKWAGQEKRKIFLSLQPKEARMQAYLFRILLLFCGWMQAFMKQASGARSPSLGNSMNK